LLTDLQGLVDLDVEIAKCEKKLDVVRMNLAKVQKVEAQPDYATTVPENVRLANEEKVSNMPRPGNYNLIIPFIAENVGC